MTSSVRSGVVVCVAVIVAASFAALPAGCGTDPRDLTVVEFDAGADADAGAANDASPTVDPTIGGPCSEDTQCDDLIPCTFDRCDPTISRCRNTPDDSQCSDQQYCDGVEKCVLRQGCVAGPVVSCQDDDGCTIDRCIEATKSCEHVQRDEDGDGDPDDHCVPHADCDDTDPTVNSKVAEICDNFKDDNCNGEVDEQPCSTAQNDTCATALAVSGPGTFLLTSVAAKKDYTTSCSVPTPAASRDLVVAITVPAGGPKDVVVRAATNTPSTDVAVALETTCGSSPSEIECESVVGASEARAIARSVAGGTTIYAIVTTQDEAAVDVSVDLPAGSTKPTNETCASPLPVTLNVPIAVSILDASRDLTSACAPKTGELTYSFTLTEPQDVRIFASTLDGPGSAIVSIRQDDCTDEAHCGAGGSPPVFARGLPAGQHVFSVAGTTQLDASILVQASPPTPPPPNQTCTGSPSIVSGTAIDVDLSNNEEAISNGCFGGGPNAAYDLELTQASDVLVIDQVPGSDTGGIALNGPTCLPADLLQCTTGAATPFRVSKRNVPAGSYRVVVADQKGLSSQILALVRPTAIPVTVTADSCADAATIPETGGFFVGDTSTATPNFDAGCDEPGQPIGGAKDQLMKLVLTQRRRVIFDMSDSSYATLLDLRNGGACPGTELPNDCSQGTDPGRSYLDVTLDPATYWVQIDGYGGDAGPWNLDVRMLPP